MLVRECYLEIMRGPDGELLLDRFGRTIGIPGERWVEDPNAITEAQGIAQDQQRAAEAATVAGNDLTVRQQAFAALDSLRQVRDAASLSATQQTAFNKLVAKVLILLVRLALGKLDGTA